MHRRHFLQKSLTGAAALATLGDSLALPDQAWARTNPRTLTILHTNDVHSRIEPFGPDAGRNAGAGGVARRAALIARIRQQTPHVLLLDAGDVFQGTPYFNFFGGELELTLMSQMGYDAATLGNHDFDNGLAGLAKQLPRAQFPFLVANYDFADTPLAGKIQPHQIFEKAGLRVGVFGLGIELRGLVAEANYGNVHYRDPLEAARTAVQTLQRKHCDLVVCLSHLGYRYDGSKVSDHTLAQSVDGIDLIIGGHTHTFLDQPTLLKSPNGQPVVVNQVGWAGLRLGRLDFTFEGRKKAKNLRAASLLISEKMGEEMTLID